MPSVGQSRAWLKVLALGCGCLTVLGVGIGALVIANWAAVEEAFRGASAAMSELFAVRAALQQEYRTAQVTVMARRHARADKPVLVVRMVNPPFLTGFPSGREREKAREIARFARDRLKDPTAYGAFDVVLTKGATVGISASVNQVFTFKPNELDVLDGA
jgi:hypothetical protein